MTAKGELCMADLRKGVRANLARELARLAGPAWPSAEIETAAAGLEQAIHVRGVQAKATRADYVRAVRDASALLPRQDGLFPDDVVGLRLLTGAAAPAAVAALGAAPPPEPGPRETVRRMFAAALMRGGADRGRVPELARRIETACYNTVVRRCKALEDPPRRHWTSAPFADMYSCRCGTVVGLLDPDSSVCRAYGARLAPRLLAGELAPEALGEASARELCPEAVAAERAAIASRVGQTIATKESTLFRCPVCGARRSTYYEKQLQGPDEAPDYFCTCLNCGTAFRGVN